jgi:alkanesulfonate monooxygenase SsuD/methylene tetrahydromethanopterin reductase-like flavin-dependent oxidoreductase (luciferase family)
VPDVGFAPKPIQQPHPPIWVGGESAGAYRRTATLADGWHATATTPDDARVEMERLRAAADEAKRPFESIELSVRVNVKPGRVRGMEQSLVDRLGAFKALGFTHVLLDFRNDSLDAMLEDLEIVAREVRPAVERA